MKVLVTGGRTYADIAHVNRVLDECIGLTVLIAGCAKGVDTLALRWAMSRQVEFRGYPAKWNLNQHAAGPIRNSRMLEDAEPDLVIVFPGGIGTADMMKKARAAGVRVQLEKGDPPHES